MKKRWREADNDGESGENSGQMLDENKLTEQEMQMGSLEEVH